MNRIVLPLIFDLSGPHPVDHFLQTTALTVVPNRKKGSIDTLYTPNITLVLR